MKTAKYNFKQSELYTIAYFILQAVGTVLPRFTAFKGKYVAARLTALYTQVDEADDEPDEEQRTEEHATLRVELVKMLGDGLLLFRAMERYIVEVFDEDVVQIKLNAAGAGSYDAAAGEDFDAAEQLIKDLSKFAEDNETVLLDGGLNMPATYRATLDALKGNFKTKHQAFIFAEVDAQTGTGEKLNKNNDVYKDIVTSINADAQIIFAADADEDIRKQFVLEHQLQLVRGAGVAGMRFKVTQSVTNEGLAEADILINPGAKALVTDADGRALQLQLAAGDYTVTISKDGYVTQTITVTVEKGTVKGVMVVMVKV